MGRWKAIDAIKTSTARVIVLHASDMDLSPFVLEMAYLNITDRTWIAREAWITSALIAKLAYLPYFGGSIGFAKPRADIPGLKEFLCKTSILANIQMMSWPLSSGKLLLTVLVFHTTLIIEWIWLVKTTDYMPCLKNSVLEKRSWKILKTLIWMYHS